MSRSINPDLSYELRLWDKEPINPTEANITEAFLKVYDKDGLQEATASRIISESGYSRGTFYKHFSNSEDILVRLALRTIPWSVIDRSLADIDTVPLEDITEAIIAFFEKRGRLVCFILKSEAKHFYTNNLLKAALPMYKGLVGRAYDLDDYALDLVSQYVNHSKMLILQSWALYDNAIPLVQLNKIEETLFEAEFWTRVALQSPKYGGPRPKAKLNEDVNIYPWMNEAFVGRVLEGES